MTEEQDWNKKLKLKNNLLLELTSGSQGDPISVNFLGEDWTQFHSLE